MTDKNLFFENLVIRICFGFRYSNFEFDVYREYMGVESTDDIFHNPLIYSNLQKYNNLRTMPLCAIVFRYVPLNSQLVTKLVTPPGVNSKY